MSAAADLRRRFDAVYTGALTDVLYARGLGAQALPARIQALAPGTRVAGPVFVYERRPFVPVEPADPDRVWDVFRATPKDHVAVFVAHCADRAVIGDLAIAFLRARGCAGLVVDGGVRDVAALAEIGLPVFCAHTTPQDVSHGSGGEFVARTEVTIGDVRLAAGDYLVGDADGVVAIPRDAVDDVLAEAEAVVVRETAIRAAILAGDAPEDVYRRKVD